MCVFVWLSVTQITNRSSFFFYKCVEAHYVLSMCRLHTYIDMYYLTQYDFSFSLIQTTLLCYFSINKIFRYHFSEYSMSLNRLNEYLTCIEMNLNLS